LTGGEESYFKSRKPLEARRGDKASEMKPRIVARHVTEYSVKRLRPGKAGLF
jgi:hypothetical protein